ncbi:MAG: diaminopimelate epimerase [Thermodesulfobacteriota bacterium]|nr:diaminopimelate epimerase [Thermodesulfobacteriota bacterium]
MTEKRNMFIAFSKMSGHGNDFIVVDNLSGDITENWSERATVWCERRTSVGADGLLVIEPGTVGDFRLRIFQADGSEAEMCGNGARCSAAFATKKGFAKSQMAMETVAGIVDAFVKNEVVAIQLTSPSPPEEKDYLDIDGVCVPYYFINSGVPHTIIFRDSVAEIPADEVAKTGYTVRSHPAFEPAGTNVDFVEVIEPGRIRVRTYERGVEEETLACGTGAVASAIISSRFDGAGEPPIQVEMPGGTLSVDFKNKGNSCEEVWLKGKVKFVYEGRITI